MAAAVRIQSDWAQVLRRNEAEVWLSCHSPGKPTLYGTLTCQGLGPDGVPEVTASEGFVVSEVTGKSIRISCPKENASSRFLAPQATFPRIHTQSVTCLDVSCGGGLGVSASTDGTMKIWQAANGEIRRVLEGHVFDVNCCRFFPSGLVVLSGGMDAQLKVWSVEDAKCAVTFKGHKGGILDTAIVDRGRNVVSASRDGTARLWDCGRSASLGVLAACGTPVNGVAVGPADNSLNLGTPERVPSEREVGTEAKLLLLAREDRKLQAVGLQSRQPVFLFEGSDAFNCCAFLSSIYVLAGTQDGKVYQLDVRNSGRWELLPHPAGPGPRRRADRRGLRPRLSGGRVGEADVHLLSRRAGAPISTLRPLRGAALGPGCRSDAATPATPRPRTCGTPGRRRRRRSGSRRGEGRGGSSNARTRQPLPTAAWRPGLFCAVYSLVPSGPAVRGPERTSSAL
ncbi:proteasomal ATPase-associated factor 1 isoform X1 [Ornithorhynchus anatinus]|uniref:Proteasomal ATPase associated factor 1 n=1 Tax=Ornithorhynchus anatinus TaxID=9258 RepID=A0A6I8PKY5_ORNAN|nr:proteasomal ATPase-associated factor 1 isoform X1 [Ornithorhynchus anatinus]